MFILVTSSEEYLKQASADLHAYSKHAGRKSIILDDVILLLRRQREVRGDRTFEYLVNTYLPMEHAEKLLPCTLMPSER